MFAIVLLLSSLAMPSQQVNINVCNKLASIFDSEGNYLKKVCELHGGYDHDKAESTCRQHGMELFVIENEETFGGLSQYMTSSWLGSGTPKVWNDGHGVRINGRRNGKGEWHTFSPKKLNLSASIPWLVDANHGDKCLTIKRNGDFKISGYKCEKGYMIMCELDLCHENINRSDDDIINVIDVRSLS